MSPASRPTLSEPSYFVLAALLDGPRHGYAIIKVVLELSDNRLKLAVGTLYSVLDRLANEDFVAVTGEEIVNGRARRYYAITEPGRAALHREAERMASAARLVTKRTSRPIGSPA
jgi:PadR family transcriptional regulator PadR